MLQKIVALVKANIVKINEFGIPLPLIRINGYPTFTGTLTLISFIVALLGPIGKITNLVGPVDTSQSNYLFLMCLGAYLGRRIQGNAITKETSLEAELKGEQK